MPWFRVDDQLDANKKVKSIPRRTRAKALGLWVQAGAWCARELTDGHVPKYMLEDFAVTPAVAQALVDAGMWEKVNDGWNFVNWGEFNPSSTDVRASRAAARKRQAEFREKKKQQRENSTTSTNTEMSRRDTPVTNSVTNAVTNGGVTRPRPDPTRPDPTLLSTGSQPSTGSRGQSDWLAGDELDALGAATQRARDAGISETAIKAGFAEYERRPHPKGPGLLRILINDAWAAERSRTAEAEARAARRATIDACNQCDDNGWVIGTNPAVKCTHQPPLKAVGGPF